MEKRVLFVDDEKSVLRSLERLFFDTDFEVYTAESAEAALQILDSQPVEIVVSDMLMPNMNGHQLLKKVKVLYPKVTRIILSGYAEEKELLASLIDGSCSMYLFKPWNGEELKQKLERILISRQLYMNKFLQETVNRLDNFSLVSGIYPAVSQLMEQEADIRAIAQVVETDPGVAASLLRVVNSAFYNIKTGSVKQAISILGLPVVKAVVLSCSLSQTVTISVPPFNDGCLLQHASLTHRFLIQLYDKLLGQKLPKNLVATGLLQNVGLLMGVHYFPEQYRRVIKGYQLHEGEIPLTELEQSIIGITHTQFGGQLLDCWGLPYTLVECALYHHDPMNEAVIDHQAVCAAHLADYYAWRQLSIGLSEELDKRAFSVLHVVQEDCESIC